MSFPIAIAIGLVLGALGGAAHLGVAYLRAGLLAKRSAGTVLLSMPLGLVGPAVAVVLAARITPVAAWATPVGILLVRFFILRRTRG